MEIDPDASQITCKFFTKLPQAYHVPDTEIAVPSTLTRYGLSQVIKHLLGEEETAPFDFLVNGVLVRTSLGKFLLAQGLSAESVLEVEYVFAVVPPDPKLQIPTDDWIGAMDGSNLTWLATACYDGQMRFWNGGGEQVGSAQVHRGPISSVVSLQNAQQPVLLTAGKLDCRLKMHEVDVTKSGKVKAKTIAVLKGHKTSILGVAASPSGQTVVSASHDCTLRLWPTGAEAIELASQADADSGEKQGKKFRGENGAGHVSGEPVIESIRQLNGHTDAVTSVVWKDQSSAASASMDFSVRKWDIESGTNVDTYHGHRALCSLTISPSKHLLGFAGSSKSWSLWDTRLRPNLDSGLKSFSSHTSHLHCVEWHPTLEHYVATGSLDKTVKLWDVRSSVPLHTLEGHTEQVLCLSWWGQERLASGGADKTIKLYDLKLGEF